MAIEDDALDVGLRLLKALVYLVVGLWVIRKVRNLVCYLIEQNKSIRPGFSTYISSIVSFFLKYILCTMVMSALELDTTAFWVAIAAFTLALALSLEDSISNMAAGIMLLTFEYYRVEDVVLINGSFGTVVALHINTTELVTADGQTVFVSNNNALSNPIVNLTCGGTRHLRLNLPFGIDYGADIHKARRAVMDVLRKSPHVLSDPEPTAVVVELGDNSVNFLARPWINPSTLGADQLSREEQLDLHAQRKFDLVRNPASIWYAGFEILEQIKLRLDAEGISIPFPQRDAHFDMVPGIPSPVQYPEWQGLRHRPGGADAFFRRPRQEPEAEFGAGGDDAEKGAFGGAKRSLKGMFSRKGKKEE